MLVQELGDVLQGQAVQRSLRDLNAGTKLNAGTNLDAQGNRRLDEVVQSNVVLPGPAHSALNSHVPNFDLSTTASEIDDDDTNASVKSSSTTDTILHEFLKDIEIDVSNAVVKHERNEVYNDGDKDVANTDRTLKNIDKRLKQVEDTQLQKKIISMKQNLQSIQIQRKEHLYYYCRYVQQYKDQVPSLKLKIRNLQSSTNTATRMDDADTQVLDNEIQTRNLEYSAMIQKTKTLLDDLRQLEQEQTQNV